MCSIYISSYIGIGCMYELHPRYIFEALGGESGELVGTTLGWWVGGHPPGWSKLQMVDGCASRLLERPPNTTLCLLPSIHSGPIKDT